MISPSLIEKYNQPIPRYTSYPPATVFHDTFTSNDYIRMAEASNHEEPRAISLYIHIPFCTRLCLYCGCNTLITNKQELMTEYLKALKKEITMVSQWLDKQRPVTQIHWGGGTPNVLSTDEVASIMDLIHEKFSVSKETEIAMECHPAHIDINYLDNLFKMGFNRISLGIQDFNSEVLKTVHRMPPAIPIEEIVQFIKESKIPLNLDFIYGLPLQTVEGFAETMQQAVNLQPDRLVTFSYAHVPWVKPHQKTLEKTGLPSPEEKTAMYLSSYETITQNGYIPIGFDHYAKPDDELSAALKNHQLHRNFQGYCTKSTTGQVYAFGMSGISQLSNAYAQNTKNIKAYVEAINNGIPATEKGYVITEEEKLTREVILELMCNNYLKWDELALRLNCHVDDLKKATAFSEEKIKTFIVDDLLINKDDALEITDAGRFFTRNIASAFDPKLKAGPGQFSKSI
ncbi:oxygen-independent coproporphyrinogen III oxidase [Alkalitalea saponilacus]|uniref:Coproporphyrinogen-III oxidase n=1 Tax=Alkalitalea saponilacus TaxID=889453 RepID=A0A1T5HSI7_9BACT|nr:oxygen-independent coproporphyrinogen III oxidase [Alkalitalea saponilacus]ASB47709.1 oxygen-independent coproporphyrinogen III oxidase [Alkalitalea saponilacus]SKC23635.1 oxygen-independent coproporphyrinogen-3 oxidase [Alkalitalea saponilacus]